MSGGSGDGSGYGSRLLATPGERRCDKRTHPRDQR